MAINVTNLTNFVSSVGSSVSNAASSARSGVSGGSTNRDSYTNSNSISNISSAISQIGQHTLSTAETAITMYNAGGKVTKVIGTGSATFNSVVNLNSKKGTLSEKLTGKYSEGLEKYLLDLEKKYGTKYVFENVFKGDKSKYDPVKRASEITGIPVGKNGKPINCGAEGQRYFDYILNGSNSKASESQIRNDYIWNNTQGINLSEGNMDKITCQSTQFGGEYIGWVGCVSTTIAAMFRINDGAEGSASELVDSRPDGSYPTQGKGGYTFDKNGSIEGQGITRNDALNIIKNELANGKVCGVKLDTGTSSGHTVLCSGIREGVSLENATWEDLLFNDVGRGSEVNREAKPYTEMDYDTRRYAIPVDGKCCVIIDTTSK